MNYSSLESILNSGDREDWLFNDERGIFTYKRDLNLRIERKEIDFDSDKFSGEDWATCHPDPTAYRMIYEVYYGSSFVDEKLLVAVDGFRAILPLPRINTNTISRQDYKFASIVDQLGTLDDYIRRARLEVGDV
ncbi:hypothetical protein Q9Y03_005130 [Vibrio harveyi]|nr:hypothetical protein [Vibrio parahaemolyticus]ELH4837117.1 hypothetical protein [Vibrio harveyi]EIU6865486.1 hypothetical protein [Vibrio parahaemolyticus]EIU7066032.1 hypothetical protein [Vibrio parahaemolyticus]ELB2132417.1 hypothetical protein [Vibrio parahaemolyticus]